MKKVLMFLALGFITATVTAGILGFALNETKTSNFHSQCITAKASTPFFRVLEKLSSKEAYKLAEVGSQTRKASCDLIFQQVKTTTEVDLSDLKLRDISFLNAFRNLKSLNLSNNRIRFWPEGLILASLRSVNLSHNRLYGTKALARNHGLIKADLSYNPLKRIGSLVRLKKLEFLNLEGTNITDYKDLEKFKYLKTILINPDLYKTAKLPAQLTL